MGRQMRESVIEVAGTKLGYREAGAGAPVLFLHGAAGASWDPLHDELSAGCRVIAPEHPGFGRGQIPDWMMGVGDVAFFYLDLMQALDLRNVHLVGHGLGGWIAAEIAIRSTARLASLALLAPAGKLVFSNNAQKFKLDAEVGRMYKVTDISRATLPKDFERNPRIHQCFELESAK